nr:MAG TPA: hypothetical protein [Caudoviricetes sp.]
MLFMLPSLRFKFQALSAEFWVDATCLVLYHK